MSRYLVTHTTRYEYEAPVLHAHHVARLRPRELPWQRVVGSRLEVSPEPNSHLSRLDYFGNECDFIEVASDHDAFEVVARSEVLVLDGADLDDWRLWADAERPASEGLHQRFGQALSPAGEPPGSQRWAASNETGQRDAVRWEEAVELTASGQDGLFPIELSCDSPLVRRHPLLRSYAEPSFPPGRSLVEATLDLNRRIFRDFKYDPTATDVSTPLAQVLRERRGVCQDFAHVAIGCLRSLGLAARYVSGYLETLPPPGKARLVGADASHAWVGVLVPGCGWLDFDPTNELVPSTRHVVVAFGRDFSDVSPLKGVVLGGAGHRVVVSVDVEPLGAHAAPLAPQLALV